MYVRYAPVVWLLLDLSNMAKMLKNNAIVVANISIVVPHVFNEPYCDTKFSNEAPGFLS